MAEGGVQQLEEWQWAVEKWHTAVKELVHYNKDKGTPISQEKTKWMLRMERVSNSHPNELAYSPCNHRIMGPDEREITGTCT